MGRRLAALLALLPAAGWWAAQAQVPRAAPSARWQGAPGPGVLVSFAPATAATEHDHRVDRLVALHVPAGSAPSAFVPAGPFRAVWRGTIEVKLRDRFRFRVAGNGTHELWIGGKQVGTGEDAKAIRLRKGANPFELRYASAAAGDATLRLLWAGSEFGFEPLPASVLGHTVDEDRLVPLARAAELRRGRELVTERQCTKCHAGDPQWARHGMPELGRDAPDLTSVGARLRPAWVAQWVADPRSRRPSAKMPRLLHGATSARDATDLATYLATLGQANEEAATAPVATARAGGELFAALGCIGCHTLPGASPPDPDRVSLADVPVKWQPRALVAFLRQPDAHYRWISMPNFALEEREATALAAFLGGLPHDALGEFTPGDAERGRRLAVEKRCAACHALPVEPAPGATALTALADWSRGCLAEDPGAQGAPDHGLSGEDRDALRAIAEHLDALGRDSTVEAVQRLRGALRCQACHSLDGRSDHLARHSAEVAELQPADDEQHGAALMTRPSLTWAGEKLRSDYLRRLFAGQLEQRSRPWLPSRMPAFATFGAALAAGLAHEHGLGEEAPADYVANPELAAIGRKLVPSGTGFACNLCHGIGDAPPMQVFEEQGINLALVRDRLRREFYHRWMANPLRIQSSTRMPKYADERGRTDFDVFDGDARAQFDAIWHYLLAGRAISGK